MPGRLIHTNEVLVHLGDAYYAERSAAQALQVLGRRQAGLAESLTDAKSELRLFQERVRAVQQVRWRACCSSADCLLLSADIHAVGTRVIGQDPACYFASWSLGLLYDYNACTRSAVARAHQLAAYVLTLGIVASALILRPRTERVSWGNPALT